MNDQLHQLLKCYICLDVSKDPAFCPSCTKIACRRCLLIWLESNNTCPHCRGFLSARSIVRFRALQEISTTLSKQDFCEVHKMQKNYYCCDCKKLVCSDCCVFSKEHKNHEFRRTSEIYDMNMKEIQNEISLIQNRVDLIQRTLLNMDDHIREILCAKESHIVSVEKYFQKICASIKTQAKAKVSLVVLQRRKISEEKELLEEVLKEVKDHITNMTQKEFIQKAKECTEMLRKIQEVRGRGDSLEMRREQPNSASKRGRGQEDATCRKNPDVDRRSKVDSLVFQKANLSFENEIVPKYVESEFEIMNFLQERQKKDIFFSDPVIFLGRIWRLKVYGLGTGVAKNRYLSVFLELLDQQGNRNREVDENLQNVIERNKNEKTRDGGDGDEEDGDDENGVQGLRYHYRLELLRPLKRGSRFESKVAKTREFSSEFKPGDCWGYNRFLPLDDVEKCLFFPVKKIRNCQVRNNSNNNGKEEEEEQQQQQQEEEEEEVKRDGSLKFRFRFRCPTYFDLSREQQQYIDILEKKVVDLKKQMKNKKKMRKKKSLRRMMAYQRKNIGEEDERKEEEEEENEMIIEEEEEEEFLNQNNNDDEAEEEEEEEGIFFNTSNEEDEDMFCCVEGSQHIDDSFDLSLIHEEDLGSHDHLLQHNGHVEEEEEEEDIVVELGPQKMIEIKNVES